MIRLAVLLAVLVGLACRPPPPTVDSGCRSCHAAAPAGVHEPFPCTTCHLGNGTATSLEGGHGGLEREPGALDTVDRTCGVCHPDQVARVRSSPMTTGRGIIGVDRWAFGETPSPDTEETLADTLAVASPSPAQEHARKLCAGCHLGARKANRDGARTGGSGCSACHAGPGDHSTLDRFPPDARCLGCHSRSSRISLTYAGLSEGPGAGSLPDGRTLAAGEPDVHAAAGLGCIDCHVHTETMGDGVSRAHQEEQVEIRCVSCHVDAGKRWGDVADPVSRRLAPDRGDDALVAVGARGTPLWNVQGDTLVSKLDRREHPIVRVGADHAGPGHARLSCQACHAAVAPTCVTCHTARDEGEQWDFAAGKTTPGRWVEVGGDPALAPPALGVAADGQIRPAIPGMIADLAGRDVRLFSLLDPHATRRAARTCAGCHRSPNALGLGSGTLDLRAFTFDPSAADGWTELDATTPGEGTRVGARSLDTAEIRRALRVGVCLECHDGDRIRAWPDFAAAVATRPARCTVGKGWWDQPPSP